MTQPSRFRSTGAIRAFRSWPARVGFGVLMAAGLVAVPVFALIGHEAILDSTGENSFSGVTNPALPTYEVLVEPTDVLLVIQVDGIDELPRPGDDLATVTTPESAPTPTTAITRPATTTDESSSTDPSSSTTTASDPIDEVPEPAAEYVGDVVALTLLTLPDTGTATALIIPPTMAVETDQFGAVPIRDAWTLGGLQGLTNAVETLLGVGLADFSDEGDLLSGAERLAFVDDERWEGLTEPLGPITFNNIDDVTGVDTAGDPIAFPSGPLTLPPDRVGAFLRARNDNEDDLNRMRRQEKFWTAWIAALAASTDPGALPGETSSGIGQFVRAHADGTSLFWVTPATSVLIPGTEERTYVPEPELAALVADMVPFPISPQPGDRVTLRVLDGTGTPGAALEIATRLVAANGEIRAIGNGPTYDYVGTQVLYYRAEDRQAVDGVLAALGLADAELRENEEPVEMVTVILGTDLVEPLGLDLGANIAAAAAAAAADPPE